jgi:cytoskeletal protein CcmA (bactofilin family)
MAKKIKHPDTIISSKAELLGNIKITGSLLIDGVLKGNVLAEKDSQAQVLISEQGQVEGEIHAPYIIVNGKVVGNVFASDKIELGKHANIIGDVHYEMMEMVMGATVNGRLIQSDKSQDNNVITSDFKAKPEVKSKKN